MTREIIMQAVNEVCQVVTDLGTRKDLHFLDCDSTHAMFKGYGNVVIINLNDIKSLEYKDEDSKDGEYICDKDAKGVDRETDQQNVQ